MLDNVSSKNLIIVRLIQQDILNFLLKIVHFLVYQIHLEMEGQFSLQMAKLFTTEFAHSIVRQQTLVSIAIANHLQDLSKIT